MWYYIKIGLVIYLIYTIIRIIRNPLYGAMLILSILKMIRLISALIIWLIYLIIPVDLIPDLVPVFGWIDDFASFFIAYRIFKILSFANKVEEWKDKLAERFKIDKSKYD